MKEANQEILKCLENQVDEEEDVERAMPAAVKEFGRIDYAAVGPNSISILAMIDVVIFSIYA